MYNWVGVVDFLQNHFQSLDMQKKEWVLQKQTLSKKVVELESQIAAGEVINIDLMKRIKILQQCLVEERRGKPAQDVDNQIQVPKDQLQSDRITKRNDEHISFLEKILAESGISTASFKNEVQQSKPTSFSIPIHQLHGHLDVVRGLFYEPKSKFIASISEDFLIKLWDSDQFNKNQEILQVSVSIREHVGFLFSLTGTTAEDANSLIFTGGNQGIIKAFDVSSDALRSRNYLKGAWLDYQTKQQKQEEQQRFKEREKTAKKKQKPEKIEPQVAEDMQWIVWELAYKKDRLLSSSSNTDLKLYSLNYEYQSGSVKSVGPSSSVTFSSEYSQNNPTSLCWMGSTSFANGYAKSNIITKWDIQSKSISDIIKFTSGTKHSPTVAHCNKILLNDSMNYLISAHQDGIVRCFDTNTNKLVKSLKHISAVSCMVIPNDTKWQLFTATHQGTIRLWDVRMSQVLKQITNTHLKKFDECIQSLALIEEKRMLLSGGADGVIKIFEY